MTTLAAALLMLWQAPPTGLVQYTCDTTIIHVGTVADIPSYNPLDAQPGYPFIPAYDVLSTNCYPPLAS